MSTTTTIPVTKLAELYAALEGARLYTRFDGAAPDDALYMQLVRAQAILKVYLLDPLIVTVEATCSM